MDEKIEKYIIDIVFATRFPQEAWCSHKFVSMIAYGGSPRASISLAKAAKAYAFIKRRGYVIPEACDGWYVMMFCVTVSA